MAKSIKHLAPCLSLKRFPHTHINHFVSFIHAKFPDVHFSVEENIDGLHTVATYVGGALHSHATRGDGSQGKDITRRASWIDGLPLIFDSPCNILSIAGVVFISYHNLDAYNQRRINHRVNTVHKVDYVPSAILNGKINAKGLLTFVPTELLFSDEPAFDRHDLFLNFCCDHGFHKPLRAVVNKCSLCHNAAADINRSALRSDHPTNGIVIKVNQFDIRQKLGHTSYAPKWAIAVKNDIF